MSFERRNILMIAPGCDGNDVGESWSCFQWVKGVARSHNVTLLTLNRSRQQPVAEQLPGVRVIDWPDLRLPAAFERFQSMAKPGYLRFYRQARQWIRTALESGEHFDLAHQVGPLALRYASPATGLGIPLVIGPLAGSLTTPNGFRHECGQSTKWYARLRELDRIRLRYDRALRASYRQADLVLGVAPYVQSLLQGVALQRFELASETGIHDLAPVKPASQGNQLRLLYVGRVVRTKGLRDVVRALGQLHDLPQVSLDVAGWGEDLSLCQAEAQRINVVDRIRFHGRVSRTEVESLYERADVFVFPSFREPSGNVVFEAMRHGLPVITTDRGGPAFVVNEQSGLKLPARDPEQLASDLAAAIRNLVGNTSLRHRLSEGALDRVAHVGLWSRKIDHLLELYQQIISQTPSQVLETSHVN